MVMYAGQVVESGPADAALRSSRTPYASALRNSRPLVKNRPHTRLEAWWCLFLGRLGDQEVYEAERAQHRASVGKVLTASASFAAVTRRVSDPRSWPADRVISRAYARVSGSEMAEQVVIFAGPMGAGKTTAIKTLSEIDVVSTEAANTDRVTVSRRRPRSHSTTAK
jgi:ABC-type glutathione transport system ATPase component